MSHRKESVMGTVHQFPIRPRALELWKYEEQTAFYTLGTSEPFFRLPDSDLTVAEWLEDDSVQQSVSS